MRQPIRAARTLTAACVAVGLVGCRTGAPRAAGERGVDNGGDPGCRGALFCDDFETYRPGDLPAGKWTTATSNGAVSVAEARHRSGRKAVRFTTTGKAAYQSAFMRLGAGVLPVAGGAFYGRMMFWLEAAPTTSVHWTMIQGSGPVPGQTHHAQYRYGGQQPLAGGNQLMANYETPDSYKGVGPSSDCWVHSGGKLVPVGTWSCVEWQFDAAANTMRFWLDGAPIDSLTVTGVGQGCVNQPASYPWTAPNFERLDLGWESYQPDEPRTFWIDDVVVSTTKVGCR
jgi:hypothetical protein